MSSEKVDPYATVVHTPENGSIAHKGDFSDGDSVAYDDLSEEEKRRERIMRWKLDIIYCFVAMIAFIFKVSSLDRHRHIAHRLTLPQVVDQYNIQNAYVSGMQEEINVKGNEYNFFTTMFNVGYIISLFPSAIVVSHFGPHYWLPGCEMLWGIMTCCLSVVQNSQTVYGLRFLVGLFEGSAWPGNTTVLSQWYLPHEIGLRMAVFNLAMPIGGIISGVMQAALSTNLEGALGRSGWRWGFIVNGVCTIFIAIVALFTQPGMPDKPNPLARWYLTDEDYAIARRRIARVKRQPQRPLTFKSFFTAFKYWQLWAIALCWAYGYNNVPSTYFNLWLKSLKNADGTKKYNVAALNHIPMGGQAICAVAIVLLCGLSDYLGARLPSLMIHTVINITSQIILIIRPKNESAYMAGWLLNYAGLPAYLIVACWAGDFLNHLPEVKAVLFATGTTISYLNVAFIPLWAFPTKQAPNWHVGAKFYLGSMCVTACLFVITAVGLRYEQRRQLRKEGKEVPRLSPFQWLMT